jgi:Grap2 and cyclin-D-interacting
MNYNDEIVVLNAQDVSEALERLAFSLKALHTDQSSNLKAVGVSSFPEESHDTRSADSCDSRRVIGPPRMTYFRVMPPVVTQSYEILQQGAAMVHASSTKYTLLSKLALAAKADPNSSEDGAVIAVLQDLLRGCQLIGTAIVLLHDDSAGCGSSARRHALQAARAIVHTTLALLAIISCSNTHDSVAYDAEVNSNSSIDDTAAVAVVNEEGPRAENEAAQKTGAVWSSCNVILERRLPLGNRNAVRRDLLSYVVECNETMQEFQDMIEKAGPISSIQEDNRGEQQGEEVCGWEAFLQGQTDQYRVEELPIATQSLALIKCSRGALNVTLQACEAVGRSLEEDSGAILGHVRHQSRLDWMTTLVDLAKVVGDGMTDLGATMYPPMELKELSTLIDRQANVMQTLLSHVLDTTMVPLENGESLDLPSDVTEMASKLQLAAKNRKQQALDDIAAALAEP